MQYEPRKHSLAFGLTNSHSKLPKDGSAVRVSPGGVSQREKTVIEERQDQASFAREDEEDGGGEEEDLCAGDEAEDLHLTQLDGGDEFANRLKRLGTDFVNDEQSKGGRVQESE